MSTRLERLTLLRPPALLRQAGIYTASQLVGRAIPFLLLPVLTRYLSPADYGVVTMFLLTATVLEPLVGLNLPGALTVKFYDSSVDLPTYLTTGIVAVALLAVPFLGIILAFGPQLEQLTSVPAAWLLLTVPLVVARTDAGALLALLRVRQRALVYGVLQNVQSAGLLALALIFVVALGFGWPGRVSAELLAWVGFAILSFVWLIRNGWLRAKADASYGRQLLRFGIPLIPHTLGAALITQTDRVLLTNLVGVGETGLYTVGYQLAVVVQLLAVSFNNAYAPWLFSHLATANDAAKRRLVRYTYLQFGVMAVLAVAVTVVMPWLGGLLLDPAYAHSGTYVGWFALGFMFSGMYYMVTNYIFFSERTSWLAAVTIAIGLANVPLTYFLININGGIGAAQATAISLGLSFVLTWVVSQLVYPMPWLLRRSQSAA